MRKNWIKGLAFFICMIGIGISIILLGKTFTPSTIQKVEAILLAIFVFILGFKVGKYIPKSKD